MCYFKHINTGLVYENHMVGNSSNICITRGVYH